MRLTKRANGLAILLCLLVTGFGRALVSSAQSHVRYNLHRLSVPGGLMSGAAAINSRDQIVGWYLVETKASRLGFAVHAILWDAGSPKDLGTLGGYKSKATGVNDNGQIVGYSEVANSYRTHAFLWQNEAMQDLETQDQAAESIAYAINSSGQITGWRRDPKHKFGHAVLWDKGVMTDLAGEDKEESAGLGISDSGLITGYAGGQAAVWDRTGKIQRLGTLGGSRSYAEGSNRSGMVIGYSFTAKDASAHAFGWDGMRMTDLGKLDGPNSHAMWINNSSQIVGGAGVAGVDTDSTVSGDHYPYGATACVWDEGAILNLNDQIDNAPALWVVEATCINDHGSIVGNAGESTRHDGVRVVSSDSRAVLLVPRTAN
jgi:probable HAF family extracellular repeat protein